MTKTLTGFVVSMNSANTVGVRVERKYRHPLYRKVVKSHKKYLSHCEIDGIQIGDEVMIRSTRPISKLKHFEVVSKTK